MAEAVMTAAPADRSEAPERDVAFDIVKRGLPVAPALVAIGAIGWGWEQGIGLFEGRLLRPKGG